MSYDIYIGEVVIESFVPEENRIRSRVNGIGKELPEAPSFRGDFMTGKGNSRHPSYSGWSKFCETVGLSDLFFEREEGLMREHPGCFALREIDRTVIRNALDKYRVLHPNAKPGWCMCQSCAQFKKPDGFPHEDLDGDLARLIWLDFWVGWALDNCKNPGIFNS